RAHALLATPRQHRRQPFLGLLMAPETIHALGHEWSGKGSSPRDGSCPCVRRRIQKVRGFTAPDYLARCFAFSSITSIHLNESCRAKLSRSRGASSLPVLLPLVCRVPLLPVLPPSPPPL